MSPKTDFTAEKGEMEFAPSSFSAETRYSKAGDSGDSRRGRRAY